jgi:hypothetical protein
MAESTNRTPSDEDARENARQHMRAARQEFRESISSFLPPEFLQHQRKARREMLLAWRMFIDRAIQRIDEKDTGTEL